MRKPQLGTEVFVAALAVLSASACSKRAESGGAVPDNAPAAVSPTATAAPSAQAAQPTAATPTPPAPEVSPTATAKAAAVDAGKEVPRPKTGAAPAKPAGDHACGATPNGAAGKGNAACGASGCSPEMKKGK